MTFNMNMDTPLPYRPNYQDSLEFNSVLRVALTAPTEDSSEAHRIYEYAITQDSQ